MKYRKILIVNNFNKTQGFRVELQVSGGLEEVTGKGQDKGKTGTRQGQDKGKTGTRQGQDRDKTGKDRERQDKTGTRHGQDKE